MNEKNHPDYRIIILLVGGLLIGCHSWLQAAGKLERSAGDAEEWQDIIPAASLLTADAISAEMRPFLFLPVPLNSANCQLLETVPGIGPGLATRIIALRNARNGFHDIAELREVKGIGPQKFERIKEFCSL